MKDDVRVRYGQLTDSMKIVLNGLYLWLVGHISKKAEVLNLTVVGGANYVLRMTDKFFKELESCPSFR